MRLMTSALPLVREEVGAFKINNDLLNIAVMQLLVKCYDNKMVKSPG